MKTKRPLLVISIILVFVLACQTLIPGANGTEIPSIPVTPQSATQPSDSSLSPLAGLVYAVSERDFPTSNKEYWQFGGDGTAHKIFSESQILYGPIFSPDGKRAVYTGYGPDFCTWLVDYDAKMISPLVCKELGNIHAHEVLDWIPGQPDTLLALQIFDPTSGSHEGGLEMISLIDGSIQTLDSIMTLGGVWSPDGQSFAYESIGYPPSGWLYSQASGIVPFLPQDYGVDYPSAGRPIWSPDGKKIAWGIANATNSAIGVFDLENKTGQALHPFVDGLYDMSISDPSVPRAFWSPDGNWLALDACVRNKGAEGTSDLCDPVLSGVWIMSADGKTENRINGNFVGWSPDSQWVLSSAVSSGTNELSASKLDGSGTISLAKTTDTNFDFHANWSPDGKYVAYQDAGGMFVAETGSWQPHQLGTAAKYTDAIWSEDGNHIVLVDDGYIVWAAETGTWETQQMGKVEITPNSDGSFPMLGLFWHSQLLPAFDTLAQLPPNTPAPPLSNPTAVSSQPDCSTSVVLTTRDTTKGEYLEVCANGSTYEIGPLAKGAYAVGPNEKFFVYCANNGLVYAVRVGDTKLQPIGDVKDFSAIIRNDVPMFEIEFTGTGPYKVTIREINYKQNSVFAIPRSISE